MLRNRLAAKLAAIAVVAVVAPLSMAGLAAAGVDLPAPAADAFERLGLTLPSQAGGDPPEDAGRSDEVQSVIDSTPPSERGCEFGHRVAEAARGEPLPEAARDACEQGEERGQPRGQQRSEPGRARQESAGQGNQDRGAGRAFGQRTSERAKQLRTATPQQRRQFGQDTAAEAKQLGASPQARQRAVTPPLSAPQAGAPGPPVEPGPPAGKGPGSR